MKREKYLYLTKAVERYYKNNVYGNKFLDMTTIRKKLTRNFLCGEVILKKDNICIVQYGKLTIKADLKRNLIIYIKNRKDKHFNNKIDERKIKYLNCLFGLNKEDNNE